MEQTDLVTFRAISNFLKDVSKACIKKYKPFALYNRLVEKTTIGNDEPIIRHINIFKNFCTSNRKNLENQDYNNLTNSKLSYSDRVYFDIKYIFKITNKVDHDAIWKHLLTISTLTDKEGNSKDILKEMKEKESKMGRGNEANFINNMVEKVGESMDPDVANPMDAVSSIMGSGVFSELVSDMNNGIESGDINLGGLMGVVQNMMGSLDQQIGKSGESGGMGGIGSMGDMGNMMNQMMSSLNMEENMSQNNTNLSEKEKKERDVMKEIDEDIENAYVIDEDEGDEGDEGDENSNKIVEIDDSNKIVEIDE